MRKALLICLLINSAMIQSSFAAGLDELSKSAPKPAPVKKDVKPDGSKAATDTAEPVKTPSPTPEVTPTAKPEVAPPNADKKPEVPAQPVVDKSDKDETEEPKKQTQSAASKSIENRLSLFTSLGWASVKPAKGSWLGLGAGDLGFRWRSSRKETGNLFITGRYVPFTGVWNVDNRDYDTTLHGIYGGAEYQTQPPILDGGRFKANVELGYMLVYAKAQDQAAESSDVKGGKLNLAFGTGADWGIVENKFRVGPFARVHLVGFTIVNVGAAAQFVF